ncbi:MAG: LysE family translocator [Ramlibacter sp.]
MAIDHPALFIAAGLLLNLTPGPDVLYIVTHALRCGARAGVVAAFGITAGCFVHIFAAAVGVSALLAASATAFTVLKWVGAGYLVYVGLRMLGAKKPSAINMEAGNVHLARAPGLKSIFFQGFWTNALNPKVALFFLAFVPQFIGPAVENKPLAFLLLGLLFNFNGLWVNIAWALAAAWLASRVGAVQRGMHWLERAAGAMFFGFGLKLALSDNPAR